MDSKRPWQSKTNWVALINAALAFWPAAAEWVANNPSVYIAIISGLMFLLRFLTKKEILLIVPVFFLMACSSFQQDLDPEIFYKRDIKIEINGQEYEGVTVVPQAPVYNLLLTPKGDLDLVLVTSCHREYSGEALGGGLFSKNEFPYEYIPVSGLEDVPSCSLRVNVYEKDKGRHSWALIAFEHGDLTLRAVLKCNGAVKTYSGVSVCQSKEGLIQRIEFDEIVRAWSPPGCVSVGKRGKVFEFPISLGECQYSFETQDKKRHTMTTIGYQGVLVREGG